LEEETKSCAFQSEAKRALFAFDSPLGIAVDVVVLRIPCCCCFNDDDDVILRVLFVIVAHSPPMTITIQEEERTRRREKARKTGNKRGEPQMEPQNSSFIPKDRNP
jgi:hypothetical protein